MNDTPDFITYACHADHHRLHPVESRFDACVPMVRVELGEDRTEDVRTPIGAVLRRDHLLFSIADVRRTFGAQLARPIERVELITPARKAGSRFSPIALFFGYERADDATPSFFVVEAGTADGKPSVLYLGRSLDDELCYETGYHPTPWTPEAQVYRSRLTMGDGEAEPGTLVVEATAPGAERPHLRITTRFERRSFAADGSPLPLRLTAEAALRVITVGHAMGQPVGWIGAGLAHVGERLRWQVVPDNDLETSPPSSRAA